MKFLSLLSVSSLFFSCFSIFASTATIPRQETPNPQMKRIPWQSLNGEWSFDYGDGKNRSPNKPRQSALTKKIIVPFAPESRLSGIRNGEFNPKYDVVWYKRDVNLPASWNNSALLHFGAVDYETEVYVNEQLVATHKGGYAPFKVDVSSLIRNNKFTLSVRAYDPATSQSISRGKQKIHQNEHIKNIFYDKSTGIRESVWIEKIGSSYISDLVLDPHIDGELKINANVIGNDRFRIKSIISYKGKVVSETDSSSSNFSLKLNNPKLWSPDNPHLYELKFMLFVDNKLIDEINSYTGFKKIEKRHGHIYLNGKRLIQRLILDQGYYPESGFTPSTIDEMEKDILLAKEAGFNGARFHQQTANAFKRYLADKHGFLYWVEVPSARDLRDPQGRAIDQFNKEAREIFSSARNGVGFIVGVGFNETWGINHMPSFQQSREQIRLTRTALSVMPREAFFSPNDGWEQITGVNALGESISELKDIRSRLILSLHNYPPTGYEFLNVFNSLGIRPNAGEYIPHIGNEPSILEGYGYDPESVVFVSEFGGVATFFQSGTIPNDIFHYGPIERDPMTSMRRIKGQFEAISSISFFGGGSCYTQLRDTENEVNGILYDDGRPKYALHDLSEGFHTYREVVPTSEYLPQLWNYRLNENDNWSIGEAGFGSHGTPGGIIRTEWNSDQISIMRKFDGSLLSRSDLNKLYLRLHHDEQTEIFLNGILIYTFKGFRTGYLDEKLSEFAQSLLNLNGENELKLTCHQTTGGQYLDAGLVVRDLVK